MAAEYSDLPPNVTRFKAPDSRPPRSEDSGSIGPGLVDNGGSMAEMNLGAEEAEPGYDPTEVVMESAEKAIKVEAAAAISVVNATAEISKLVDLAIASPDNFQASFLKANEITVKLTGVEAAASRKQVMDGFIEALGNGQPISPDSATEFATLLQELHSTATAEQQLKIDAACKEILQTKMDQLAGKKVSSKVSAVAGVAATPVVTMPAANPVAGASPLPQNPSEGLPANEPATKTEVVSEAEELKGEINKQIQKNRAQIANVQRVWNATPITMRTAAIDHDLRVLQQELNGDATKLADHLEDEMRQGKREFGYLKGDTLEQELARKTRLGEEMTKLEGKITGRTEGSVDRIEGLATLGRMVERHQGDPKGAEAEIYKYVAERPYLKSKVPDVMANVKPQLRNKQSMWRKLFS